LPQVLLRVRRPSCPFPGRRAVLILIVAGLSAIGCNREDDLTGAYVGNMQLNFGSASTLFNLRLTLSDSEGSLSGTLEATEPVAGVLTSGDVTGRVNGSAVTLSFKPTTRHCPAELSGTRQGVRLSGTLTVQCSGAAPVPGTFDVSKQPSP